MLFTCIVIYRTVSIMNVVYCRAPMAVRSLSVSCYDLFCRRRWSLLITTVPWTLFGYVMGKSRHGCAFSIRKAAVVALSKRNNILFSHTQIHGKILLYAVIHTIMRIDKTLCGTMLSHYTYNTKLNVGSSSTQFQYRNTSCSHFFIVVITSRVTMSKITR